MRRRFVFGIVTVLLLSSVAAAIFLLRPAGESPASVNDYSHYPFYVSISADGSYVLVRYRASDGFVGLFGKIDNVPLWTWESPISYPDSSSISADGNYITVGADRLYLFTKGNDEPIWSHPGAIYNLISADGNYITAADMYKLYLFSRTDNALLWSHDLRSPSGAPSLSLSADGSYIAVGNSYGQRTYLFGKTDNTPLWSYSVRPSVSISASGDFIAVSGSNSIYLFAKADNVPIWAHDFNKTVRRVVISADGNYIAVIASEYIYHSDRPGDLIECLYVFSRENAELLWSSVLDVITEAGTGPITFLAISSDGSYIAAGDWRKFYLFSRVDNVPLWSHEFFERESAYSVAISSDGNYIVIGTEGGSAPNIGGSVYLFGKENNTPLWVYLHEVSPWGYV